MTQPSNAAPKPEPRMTDVDIRIQCVDLAVKASAQSTVPTSEKDITTSAREFYNFITEGNGNGNP